MNPSLPDSMHQDINKMKGDAIGDTMYSERWVLKTLMKLSKKYTEYCNPDDYHLESDLEGDLGLLWDMTIEPDVAGFLVENNALELITDVVSFSSSPRLTEIMIGILGNLACQEHIRQKIGTETDLMKVIINLLKFSDSPTLIQLIRLLRTCIWNVDDERSMKELGNSRDEKEDNTESKWMDNLKMESELLYQSLSFILASSRNEDLLCSTLGLIESLFNLSCSKDDYFCKQFSTEDFIKALLEAMKEISSHVEDGTDSLLSNRKLKEASSHWVSILHRLTCNDVGRDALEKQADALFSIVNAIWVEQSARCSHLSRSHIVHLLLALELLGLLLPLQSQRYETGHALKLLSRVIEPLDEEDLKEEEEKVSGGNLKEALEEFCFLVLKNWKLKSEFMLDDLKCYSEVDIDLLKMVLVKKLGKTTNSIATTDDLKHWELKTLIANIPSDM